MFNEIGKFLGLVREEPNFMQKVSHWLATNWTGMVVGACIALAIVALAYGVKAIKAKHGKGIKAKVEEKSKAMLGKAALWLGKIRGKKAKPQTATEES